MALTIIRLLAILSLGAAYVSGLPPIARIRDIFDIRPTLSNLDMCEYLKNVTDIETLEQHQFGILEQCLYYYLANQAQRKAANLGVIHAIATLPPPPPTPSALSGSASSPSDRPNPSPVQINFKQITLQHFELNEFIKDLTIHGYMETSWNDARLSWDREKWKLQKLTIHSIAHIWVPILTAQSYDTALRNGDMMEMRKIHVSDNGTVSTLINFSLKTFCDDTDFKNFPDDVYKCCFQIEPHLNQEIIEFVTSGKPIYTDPKYFRDYGWLMSGTVPISQADSTQVTQLKFCINLQRASNSIRIELTLPMTITSILFLLTPFLGQIRIQMATKMFILFLQFICLQLFSHRIAPFLGSATTTPKLLRFLEFAMIMNTMSIAISIVLWMCSKIQRNLPPWAWLIQCSKVINRFLCVFNSSELAVDESISLEKGGATGTASSNYHADWTNAFVAIHSAAVTALSLVFIFGYLILL